MRLSRSSAKGLAESLVTATVCLLPWAFGGVESWAWRTASILLVVGCAAWIAFGGGAEQLLTRRPPWLFPAGLLCGWAILQTVPLPVAVLGVVSPGAAQRIERALPGFGVARGSTLAEGLEDQARAALPSPLPAAPAPSTGRVDPLSGERAPRWHAVSIAPAMTAECAAWYVALLAAALVVSARAESPGARSRIRFALFANLALLAIVGLLQKVTWNGALLWMRPVEGGLPFGPYVNGIHFAGMMEMGVPWMAAYAAARWASRRRADRPLWIVAAVGAAAAVAFVAGIAAQSKLAAALMAVGLSALTLAAFDGVARLRAAVGVAAAWVVASMALEWTALGGRFREFGSAAAAGIGDYERVVVWKAMLPALRDYWLCGAGYGTFRYVAPAYLPGGDGSGWLQLHNDWLESALSGGILGTCLLLALVAVLGRTMAASFHGLESRAARIERLGILIGLASLCAHAVVDFNHQIPANALMFVAVSAYAASSSMVRSAEIA